MPQYRSTQGTLWPPLRHHLAAYAAAILEVEALPCQSILKQLLFWRLQRAGQYPLLEWDVYACLRNGSRLPVRTPL
jgi:hypothetical protein